MPSLHSLLFFSFSLLFLLSGGVRGGDHHDQPNRHRLLPYKVKPLFVFGDSYVDTGNNRKTQANSWADPYGITFPGKPSGRYSDGRVFSDYIARFLGLKSPIPYRWRKYAMNHLKYGLNFAYGGSGVFNTLFPVANMTIQIDYFQQIIQEKIYTKRDLQSSVALISLAGNDYSAYLKRNNGSNDGIVDFIKQVVGQLTLNLKRIYELGVRKIAVSHLQPLGCLPQTTITTSFKQCNGKQNELVVFHNILLDAAVASFNNMTKRSDTFITLDLYKAFLTVFKNNGKQPGSTKFENILKPCCVGVSPEYSCGNEENGIKKYTVCENPEAAFFWDDVHPTQQGWRSVYLALEASLHEL